MPKNIYFNLTFKRSRNNNLPFFHYIFYIIIFIIKTNTTETLPVVRLRQHACKIQDLKNNAVNHLYVEHLHELLIHVSVSNVRLNVV